MTTHTVNQHLRRSLWAIMQQGGLKLNDNEKIVPKPMSVGRNAARKPAEKA